MESANLYNGNTEDKIEFLLKNQERCISLLTSAIEYKPGSDMVKSLEQEFNSLALTNQDKKSIE